MRGFEEGGHGRNGRGPPPQIINYSDPETGDTGKSERCFHAVFISIMKSFTCFGGFPFFLRIRQIGVCKSVLSFLIGKALHPGSVFIREGSLAFRQKKAPRWQGYREIISSVLEDSI